MRRDFIAVFSSVLLAVATLAGCSSGLSSNNLQYRDPPKHQGAYGDNKDELTSKIVGFKTLVSTRYDDMEVFQRHFKAVYLNLKEDGTGSISKAKKNGKVSGFSVLWEASNEDDIMLYHDTFKKIDDGDSTHYVNVYIPMDAHYEAEEETLYVDGTTSGFGGTMRFRDSSKGLEAPALWQEGSEHDVTSGDDVLGSWEISGYMSDRVTVVGEGSAIAAWLKDPESDATPDKDLTFERNGSGRMLGQDLEWKIEDGGCTLRRDGDQRSFSIQIVDDNTLLVRNGDDDGVTYRFKRYE